MVDKTDSYIMVEGELVQMCDICATHLHRHNKVHILGVILEMTPGTTMEECIELTKEAHGERLPHSKLLS